MIGLIMFLVGCAVAVIGILHMENSPAPVKADGLLIAVFGFVLAFFGLALGFLT